MGIQQLRTIVRRLRRDPIFACGVVAVIALAVGANAAIFTVFDRVLMRPLPLRDPARLVTLAIAIPGNERFPLSLPDFDDVDAQNRTLEGAAAYFGWSVNLTGVDEAERLQAMRVSPNFFQLTGAGLQLGRAIQPDDEGRPVAMITHGLWQRRFGGSADTIGKTLVLNGDAFTIVGVARPDFVSLVRDAEIIAPFAAATDPRRANRAQGFLRVIGRLKPGVTLAQAADDLDGVSRRMRAAYPDTHGTDLGMRVRLLHEEISGRVAPMLRMLLAAVVLVLLVACANVATLLLVHGARRARELAVRAALGASRARIVSQLVAEAVVLGIAGGALGLLVARAFVSGLIAIGPADLPRVAEIAIDLRVALFTFAVSIGASLVFGVIPALHLSRGDLQDVLRGGDRAVSGGRGRLRAALIFSEVALSTLLLIAAALLARSFQRVQEVDPGFRPVHVLSIRLSLPRTKYGSRAAIEGFFESVQPRLASLPGVRAVAAANVVPMNGYLATAKFVVDGVTSKDTPEAHYRTISPEYFRALGIPLRSGRVFTPADRQDAQPVAIVSETLARQYWPGASAIGARLRLEDGEKAARAVEIVGVVADVRHFGLEKEPALEVYVPIPQVPEATTIWLANNMYWVLQTDGAPLAATNAARREIAAVDPGVPASFARSMDQWVAASIAPRRFSLQLVEAFAFAALLLAVVGVYAVSSSSVGSRTREIGIRTALGASRAEVIALVLRSGLAPVVLGLVAGAGGAVAARQALSTLLFGVGPLDPVSLAAVAVTLTSVAFVASYIPARRAARIDPVRALRAD